MDAEEAPSYMCLYYCKWELIKCAGQQVQNGRQGS